MPCAPSPGTQCRQRISVLEKNVFIDGIAIARTLFYSKSFPHLPALTLGAEERLLAFDRPRYKSPDRRTEPGVCLEKMPKKTAGDVVNQPHSAARAWVRRDDFFWGGYAFFSAVAAVPALGS